jgi:hypothetical protein
MRGYVFGDIHRAVASVGEVKRSKIVNFEEAALFSVGGIVVVPGVAVFPPPVNASKE